MFLQASAAAALVQLGHEPGELHDLLPAHSRQLTSQLKGLEGVEAASYFRLLQVMVCQRLAAARCGSCTLHVRRTSYSCSLHLRIATGLQLHAASAAGASGRRCPDQVPIQRAAAALPGLEGGRRAAG